MDMAISAGHDLCHQTEKQGNKYEMDRSRCGCRGDGYVQRVCFKPDRFEPGYAGKMDGKPGGMNSANYGQSTYERALKNSGNKKSTKKPKGF